MKKTILTFAILLVSMSAYAETSSNDTIPVNNDKIEKVIVDDTVNSKGKPVKKYYVVYDGKLVPTSKTVVEQYELAKKHSAKVGLAMVVKKDTNRKRIILN